MVDNTINDINENIALRLEKMIAGSPLNHTGLCRFEVDIEDICPVQWLKMQTAPAKFYLSSRGGDFEVAGIGTVHDLNSNNTADIKETFDIIESSISASSPNIKYFGGAAFDMRDCTDEQWESFGAWRFVVPEFEICRENDRLVFACNVDSKLGLEKIRQKILNGLERLAFDLSSKINMSFPGISNRCDVPGTSTWTDSAESIIAELKQSDIRKVVLARKSNLELSSPCDPVDIFAGLKARNVGTYDFAFSFDGDRTFAGSSPERLYTRDGNNIYTEALAGTRPVGNDTSERKQFEQQLKDSPKEQVEHDFVYDDITDVLGSICEYAEVLSRREIVCLRSLQHFKSRFCGKLNDLVSDYDIIKALHPTAAVNGLPRENARNLIAENEPFSRGWFAGPIGWIGADKVDFAVAIRSALISSKEISLFAGAGIVESSNPADEWQETENKMKQFMDIFSNHE